MSIYANNKGAIKTISVNAMAANDFISNMDCVFDVWPSTSSTSNNISIGNMSLNAPLRSYKYFMTLNLGCTTFSNNF